MMHACASAITRRPAVVTLVMAPVEQKVLRFAEFKSVVPMEYHFVRTYGQDHYLLV